MSEAVGVDATSSSDEQSVRFTGFTPEAAKEVEDAGQQHILDIVSVASVLARREKSEVVTARHVGHAEGSLGIRSRRRGLGLAIGGALFGAGLSDLITKLQQDTPAPSRGWVTTLLLFASGVAMMCWDWFKN